MNYTVNDEGFDSFTKAIDAAAAAGADVIETATGIVRWTPGKISAKAARMYRERKAAYNASVRDRTKA